MGACDRKILILNFYIMLTGLYLYSYAYAKDKPMENNPKAVCLVLHGLNLKPEKMNDWMNLLTKHGCKTTSMELSGHNGDNQAIKEVNAKVWREDFHRYAKDALEEAKNLKVPLYFLGFSLGGLMGTDWQLTHKGFSKMVLLAPALAVPWYAKAVGLLNFLGDKAMLPSKSPKSYQANQNGISLAAYKALFDIRDELEQSPLNNINMDTLVIMDQGDELVPFKKIREIIEKHRLSKWQLNVINNQFAHNNFGFRHLLVDKNSVGDKMWDDISKKVIDYFGL